MGTTSFADFMASVKSEAVAEGPAAVEHLQRIEHRFRVAGQLLSLRRDRGVTQRKLADLTGIHQSEISRIERGVGNPTGDTLERLAGALGAHVALVPATPAIPNGSSN